MKPGRPIVGLTNGQPIRCIAGSHKLRLRRNAIYTFYQLRNELFRWVGRGGVWKLHSVILNGREIARTGRFVPVDFCPKCFNVWSVGHDSNRCNTDQK